MSLGARLAFLRPSARPALGVDAGSSALKIVALRVDAGATTVVAAARREWAGAAAEDRARILRETVRAARAATRLASAALPTGDGLLRFSSAAASPFPPEETALDSAAIGGETVVLFARAQAVRESLALLSAVGLAPEAVVTDSLALADAYEFYRGAGTEPTALVNVGASAASIEVLERGVPRAARVVNVGGDALTRALELELSLSAEEAEEFKREYGLLGASSESGGEDAGSDAARIYRETAARVLKALKPGAKDLAVEIRRTLDAYRARRPADAPAVGRVVLAGGTADMKGLGELMNAEIGLPVEIFRPLEGATALRASDADLSSASFAVACGLALNRELKRRRPERRPDLLPASARRAAAVRRLAPSPAAAAVSALTAAAVALGLSAGDQIAARIQSAGAAALTAARRRRPTIKSHPPARAAVAASKKGKGRRGAGSRFSFLAGLKASGALGRDRDAVVMLSSRKGAYVARGGRLFDTDDRLVDGVVAEIIDGRLILTAERERVVLPLPR